MVADLLNKEITGVKIWEDYKNKHNKSFNIYDGIIMLNNVGGICRARKNKITWDTYKELSIEQYPFMKGRLPNKL